MSICGGEVTVPPVAVTRSTWPSPLKSPEASGRLPKKDPNEISTLVNDNSSCADAVSGNRRTAATTDARTFRRTAGMRRSVLLAQRQRYRNGSRYEVTYATFDRSIG